MADGPNDLLPREKGGSRWWFFVGLVVIAIVAIVVGINAAKIGNRPGTAQAVTPPASPQVITMTVTGSGAANSVTVLDGTGESQHENVPLPYTTTTPLPGAKAAEIEGQNGPTGSISCELSAPGYVPITHSSSGAYAVVDCGAKF